MNQVPEKYVFDFTIPQGPTGPVGSTSYGLYAYAERYNNTTKTMNLSANKPEQVELLNFTTANNADYRVLSSIGIKSGGAYEITYMLDATSSVKTTLTVAVRQDGANIVPTVNTKNLEANTPTVFCGNAIAVFNEEDIIDVVITSSTDASVTLNNNASLVVKEID